MKNFILIIIFSLFASSVFGQSQKKYDVDKLKLGTSSAHDTELDLSGSVIKKNKTTNKIQFSNDGTIWKNLGSGSGSGSGGVSSLENGSFEDGQGSWTNTGGTFSILEYTNPSESNSKYARFVASGAGEYFQTPLITFSDDITGACIAYIGKYKTSDNNAFDFRLLDSSNNQIDSKTLATTNGNWSGGDVSNGLISFPCPSVGTQYRLRVISLAAGTIDTDLFYAGSENRLVEVKPSGLILDAHYAGVTGCSVSASSSSTWADFGTSANCVGLTVNYSAGGVTASTTDIDRIDRITLNNLKAGKYKVSLQSQYNNSTTVNFSAYRITDGTQSGQGSGGGTQNSDNSTHYAYFDYSSDQSSVTFKVQCYSVSPSSGCSMLNSFPSVSQSKWIVERVDTSSDLAISQSQSEWMIDVNIGGANASLSTTSVSSYTEITNGSLDMVINSGSAPAKIPCTGTNASTGITCSAVNEGVGVVFNPPYAGKFLVCSEFSHRVDSGASSYAKPIFQIVLTENSSQTILQEGKSRTQSGITNSSSTGSVLDYDHRKCSIFNFSDTSEKTIRLMYEIFASGTVTSVQLLADRDAGNGQRDINITVVPLKNGITPMKMGDTLTSKGASSPDFCSAKVSATGALSYQVGGCFASCTNAITPVCTFTSGYWKSGSIPNCWAKSSTSNVNNVAPLQDTSFASATSYGAPFVQLSTGTIDAGAREYFCHGQTK